VIISGPSGSGKGTVVKQLDPACGYALSISVTTRPPRAGEMDGRDYFFRSEDEFARMRRNNELLEHAVYVGHYYGTPRRYVEDMIALGKAVVLEIEVNGALQVREQFPKAVLIFLMPPTAAELARRLLCRNTEEPEVIEDRLKKARSEIALIPRYDYVVINDEIPKAVTAINTIVAAERLRPERIREAFERFGLN